MQEIQTLDPGDSGSRNQWGKCGIPKSHWRHGPVASSSRPPAPLTNNPVCQNNAGNTQSSLRPKRLLLGLKNAEDTNIKSNAKGLLYRDYDYLSRSSIDYCCTQHVADPVFRYFRHLAQRSKLLPLMLWKSDFSEQFPKESLFPAVEQKLSLYMATQARHVEGMTFYERCFSPVSNLLSNLNMDKDERSSHKLHPWSHQPGHVE